MMDALFAEVVVLGSVTLLESNSIPIVTPLSGRVHRTADHK
jgi:hypothetical protein